MIITIIQSPEDLILRFIVPIVGFILIIVFPLVGSYFRRKRLREYYEVVWKKATSLKPDELLKGRPFERFYYERPQDKEIRKAIDEKKNVLIVGMPLAGKTRAIYQVLKDLRSFDVIIPRCVNINFESFFVPKHFSFWRGCILLLDDFHRFVEVQNFEYLLRKFHERDVVVVALCRSEAEYKKAKNMMMEKGMEFSTIFGKNVIELRPISETEGRAIAEKTGKQWGKVRFNRTIGSIFMPLEEMERRFHKLDKRAPEIFVLRAIKLLYLCGIYEEKRLFPPEWIKAVCHERYELDKKEHEWIGLMERLKEKEFIKLVGDKIRIEEVYIEDIIKLETEIPVQNIFRKMLTIFSNNLKALFRLGRMAHSIGSFAVAVEAYEQALELDRTNVFTWVNAGQSLGNLKRYEEALGCANKALELSPRNAVARAFAWHNKGFYLHKLGRNKEAIECYDSSLQIDQKYAPSWHNKGYSLYKMGEYEKAIECYDKALKLDPNNEVTWDNKGYSLIKLRKHGEAIKCFDKALETDPKFVKPWNNKGQALGKLGMYEEALKCLDKALSLALESDLDKADPAYVASIWDNKGYVLNSQKRYEEAIECFDKALSFDPKYASAWNNKAYALLNLRRYKEAIEWYDKYLEADPKYVYAWINKAWCFSKLGKYEKAVECCEKAIEIEPHKAVAWKNKGFCLEKLERLEEALKCYEMVLEIEPDDPAAWKLKGYLLKELGKDREASECFKKASILKQASRKKQK